MNWSSKNSADVGRSGTTDDVTAASWSANSNVDCAQLNALYCVSYSTIVSYYCCMIIVF